MPDDTSFWLQNPVARSFYINDRFNTPREYGKHEGLDLAAVDAAGNPVEVRAAQSGKVVKTAQITTGYGKYVVIQHDWPDGNKYVTWYGHLSQISISQGEYVNAGQKLGIAGTTGNSTGIHLHLTLQWLGHGLSGYVVPDVVDPLPYFRETVPSLKQATFISDETIPDGMSIQAGTPFVKTWRLRNSGTVSWGSGCTLAFFGGEKMGAPDSVPLPDTSPGGEILVSVPMTAPATIGRQRSNWKPKEANGSFFEQVVWAEIVVTPQVTEQDNALFLADVTIPDGTELETKQTFLKQWRVRNTGASTWRSGYLLAFVDGDQMDAPDSVPVPYTRPGEEAVVGVTMKASDTPGSYRSNWQLRNLQGQNFGALLHTSIKVNWETTPQLSDQLSYVDDVTFEDGTRVLPGQVMNKIWRVRNTGQTTWGTGYTLAFFGHEQMGAPGSIPLPAIGPGQVADIALSLTAPTTPGVYRSTWKPCNNQGQNFNFELYTEIQVVSSVDPDNPVDNSRFEKDVTIPDNTVIQAGAAFAKTWRMRNTGTTTWQTGYKLKFFQDEKMSSVDDIASPGVEPGDSVDISVPMTAPLTPGSHRSTWKMCNSQGDFFGDIFYTLIKTPTPVPVTPDNRAQFMGHETVDLGAIMQPGQVFEKIWRVRNIGKTPWGDGYTLAFLDGVQMNGPESVAVPAATTYQTVKIKVTLTAPSITGYYKGYWKLRDPRGELFGPRLPVWIQVKVVP
jgi:hypothetical protein